MMTTLTASDGHELDCWIENPSGDSKGGLVILQEIFGVTDQLKGLARRYAALDYTVAVPALFDRQQRGAVIPFDAAAPGRDLMLASDPARTLLDIAAAVDALAAGGSKVAVMGFCWGGGLAIRAAQKLDIAGAVSFYGTRLPQYLDCPLKAPVLGHFGSRDDHVPPEMLQQAKDYLPGLQVHMYDTGHAFANDARPAMYDRASAELAHERTTKFLAERLG
ncbi:MAG: dienelactone hydrolase family protein [Rhodobacter sp.]|nr:dienelactone hydrolase family protein [Rhodobacter sp.]